MTPADSLSQIAIFQYMVIRGLCNQKCPFSATVLSLFIQKVHNKVLWLERQTTVSNIVDQASKANIYLKKTGPEVIKLFFMLNWIEHEMFPTHKC